MVTTRFILSTRNLKAESKVYCVTTIFFRSLYLLDIVYYGKIKIRKFWTSFLNHYDLENKLSINLLRFMNLE